MVYIKKGDKKKRMIAVGKLVSISSNKKNGVKDEEAGQYIYIDLSIVDERQQPEKWYNVRVYDVDMLKCPELSKADGMLQTGQKPLVQMVYYESEKLARDISNNPKVYINQKANFRDLVKHFKIVPVLPQVQNIV